MEHNCEHDWLSSGWGDIYCAECGLVRKPMFEVREVHRHEFMGEEWAEPTHVTVWYGRDRAQAQGVCDRLNRTRAGELDGRYPFHYEVTEK